MFARSALRAAVRAHAPPVASAARSMATAQPAILNRDMGKNQWYVHLSREEGASLDAIKAALQETRADCAAAGINLTIGVGPGLLPELSPSEVPADFSSYPLAFESTDGSGKKAVGTQEELLLWVRLSLRRPCSRSPALILYLACFLYYRTCVAL